MSKRHDRARYTLPDVINPDKRKCISVLVPDNPYHIAAFRGQLEALARAYSWENDTEHTALEVARVWRDVVDNTEDCSMEFRQDDCHLYLVQGGVETLIYNGQLCIDANIKDGILKPGVANSGLGDKSGSSCYPYTFELSPLEIYYIPQHVNEGDSLTFIDYSGGTQDITGFGAFWHCPTGQAYEFGHCSSGIRGGALPDDLSQSIAHASLMVRINNVYYDLFDGLGNPITLTVPSGVSDANCAVILNYGSVVGPTAVGTVKGTIEWCRNSLWCHTWDFTTEAGPFHGLNNIETWQSGVGWLTGYTGNVQIGGPQLNTGYSPFYITSLSVEYDNAASDPFQNQLIGRTLQNPSQYTYSFLSDESSGLHTFTWILPQPTLSDQFHTSLDCASQSGHNITKRLTVHGVGINPFSGSNC